jgi:hypothetical protein
MTPESRDNPLLDNGSLTQISMEMRIRGERLCTERVFRVNGIDFLVFPLFCPPLYLSSAVCYKA